MDPRIQYPEEFSRGAADGAAPDHTAKKRSIVDPDEFSSLSPEVLDNLRANAAWQAAASASYSQSGEPRRMTRAEAREIRRREREEGVEFWLKNTGIAVRVRDLPFSDRTMLQGIPDALRAPIGKLLTDAQQVSADTPDLATALRLVDGEAALTDGVCIAGFLWPRLVRTEAELDGSDDVWLVDDLHPDEKLDYRKFVFRNRDGAQGDTARLASFRDAGLAQAPGR